MESEMVEDVEYIEKNKNIKMNVKNNCFEDKKKLIDSDVLPVKYFQIRNSLLTDLCNDVNHLRTIYNIFATVLIYLIFNSAAHDYFNTGSLQLGLTTMYLGFGKFSYVVTIWLQMMILTISVYGAYSIWALNRMNMPLKSFKIKIWDYSWLIIFIIYQLGFIIIPPMKFMKIHLPPPSACIIVFEQIRMAMKIHAFVRSTVPPILSYKPHTEKCELSVPGFSKFIYFLFAPTIVYRDNYPRTKKIRWRFVVWYFFEFFMTIYLVTFMFERYIIPVYKNFGIEPFNQQKLILNFFNTLLPSAIISICGFYCLLHAWMNAFAELLRFGDRLFYKDWWNSTSYAEFYRTWNVVVHDWLYVYIYKDIYEIIAPHNKILAQFSVFFVSAIFHEYIIGISLNLFCPIMLIIFGGMGYILMFINRTKSQSFGNIFFWFSFSLGGNVMLCLYSMEYFSRINCLNVRDDIYELIIPRILFCYNNTSSVVETNINIL